MPSECGRVTERVEVLVARGFDGSLRTPRPPQDVSEFTAHHVGITVSDLDRTVSFYRDKLGLDLLTRFEVGGEAFSTGVDLPEAHAEFAHLDAGGTRLELVTYDSTSRSASEVGSESRLDTPGTTHVGLAVEDVEDCHAELPDDVETLSEPQTTESGTTIFFVRDPEGNLVEVLSP
ncbi:Catechol 2,3-dioxygenase [Halobellus limi]|uniref:Catechol 2,3-dioxygenase n=1 Tax=Halobellus limi TaxID=699433 RepID=A0A1H6CTM5_9EURY|nr:Catechol 2,3-dioxygenase [Halobellus limi]